MQSNGATVSVDRKMPARAFIRSSVSTDDEETRRQLEADASLAALLQQEETEEQQKLEMDSMNSTLDGRAWLFVNKVLDLQKRLESTGHVGLKPVSVDDMVFLTKRFLQCQAEFEANGWPSHVTIAYHYTKFKHMESIKEDGLMSLADRYQQYGQARGAEYYGNGVYTATNPFGFYGYADSDVGLLVLVIRGHGERHLSKPAFTNPAVKTVIGNKRIRDSLQSDYPEHVKFFDEWVLQESRQCLPLLQFDASLVSTIFDKHAGNDAVWVHHKELHKIIDGFFNGGQETSLTRITPGMKNPPGPPMFSQGPMFTAPSNRPTSQFNHQPLASAPFPTFAPASTNMNGPTNHVIHWQGSHFNPFSTAVTPGASQPRPPVPVAATAGVAQAVASSTPNTVIRNETLEYTAPQTMNPFAGSENVFASCSHEIGSTEECPICLETLYGRGTGVVRLKTCSHRFHASCIKDALTAANKCPMCRKRVSEARGKCPSGTMCIAVISAPCSGFEQDDSIVVEYNITSGDQMSYHANPGLPFHGTRRVAYLPDNQEGKRLLERLKWAWMHGLTFSIGDSLTTGRSNSVIWSVHHKTSRTSGPHGFPDPNFFTNCNLELDSLGVPKAST